MSHPVSVAMTTCNGERFISSQIDSLLQQQLKPSEIIVCDDASTDGTLAILERYASDGHLTLHKNAERLGVIANFKKAVSLCREGNFVALCDQDDYWQADKLSECAALLATIAENKPGLVFSDTVLADESLHEIAPSFWKVLDIDPAQESLHSLLYGNFITGCTVLMNVEMRHLFLEMPEHGVSMHDAWLGLIAYSFGEYKFIRRPLMEYRQHGGNITFGTNNKATFLGRIGRNMAQMLDNAAYLDQELTLAETFYNTYGARLNPLQKITFENFISLRQATFFKKKKLALAARAYRRHSKN